MSAPKMRLVKTIDGVRIYRSTFDETEYVVVYENDSPWLAEYFTDCLQDAINTAHHMASE